MYQLTVYTHMKAVTMCYELCFLQGGMLFSVEKYTEVLVRRADCWGDLFQHKLQETVSTTAQVLEVTKTW